MALRNWPTRRAPARLDNPGGTQDHEIAKRRRAQRRRALATWKQQLHADRAALALRNGG